MYMDSWRANILCGMYEPVAGEPFGVVHRDMLESVAEIRPSAHHRVLHFRILSCYSITCSSKFEKYNDEQKSWFSSYFILSKWSFLWSSMESVSCLCMFQPLTILPFKLKIHSHHFLIYFILTYPYQMSLSVSVLRAFLYLFSDITVLVS